MLSLPSLVVLILIAFPASGQLVNWYNCPKTCVGECRCASSKPPVPNPPQFILLTHDDAVTSFSTSTVLNTLKNLHNPNGCGLPATFYVSIKESLDYLIHHLYMSNHEIADHTVNHVHLPDQAEIWGAIQWMNHKAEIPIEEIRGFRAPFLQHDVAQRQALYKLGLKYDSSITEHPNNNQLFPYSLDHGVAIDCSVGTGTCTSSESYPGMWSVPLWTLPGTTPMDITGDVYLQYMRQFRKKYFGSRAPLGIFCHSGWLSQNLQAVRKFISDALAMGDDVWVVTNWQLIQWMKNPVSAKEYRKQTTSAKFCPRAPKGHIPPSSGCVFGSWDKQSYRCKCQGEGNPTSNGFCRDADGACTIPKFFTNGLWHCTGEQDISLFSVINQAVDSIETVVKKQAPEFAMKKVGVGLKASVLQNHRDLKGMQRQVKNNVPKKLPVLTINPTTGRPIFYGVEIPEEPYY